MLFYLMTVVVYFFDDAIWIMGLNLQMGMAGIVNLGYVLFLGIGGYIAAILTLGPATPALNETYILGAKLPFPIPWIAAMVVIGALAYLIGYVVLRRMRGDYLAVVTLAIMEVVWTIVGNDTHLFNGDNGITLIPQPWSGIFGQNTTAYSFFFLALMAAFAVLTYWFAHSYLHSPLGRATRAVRENEAAASALGKNPFAMRMTAFVAGACLSALAGALLVEYITVWIPSAWAYVESFTAICALIVGGRGNNKGAVLGALLVPVLFSEVTRFLPPLFGNPNLTDALQWIAIGLLVLAFLWFRPQGVIPEAKARWRFVRPESSRSHTMQHLTKAVSEHE